MATNNISKDTTKSISSIPLLTAGTTPISASSNSKGSKEEILEAIQSISKQLNEQVEVALEKINIRITNLEDSKSDIPRFNFSGSPDRGRASSGTNLDPDFASTNLKTIMPKNLRRQTLSEISKNLNLLDSAPNEVVVSVTKTLPDHSHLILKDFNDKKKVIWFFNQVEKYIAENNYVLLIRNLLSTKAINILLAHFHHDGLTNHSVYYGLSNAEITEYIYRVIAPRDREEAYDMLASVTFRLQGYRYTSTNSDEFYECFIQYERDFEDMAAVVEYSKVTNHGVSLMPPCTKNPMGVISIVTKAINPTGGVVIVDNIINQTDYAIVKSWADDEFGYIKFLRHLDKALYIESQRAKANKAAAARATRDYKTGLDYKPTTERTDPRIRPGGRLNHFQTSSYAQDSEEDLDPYPYVYNPQRDFNRPVVDDDLDVTEDAESSIDPFEQAINNLTSTGKPLDKPNGCLRILYFGTCKNGDKCTFSHESGNLTRTCMWVYNAMRKSKYFKPPPSTSRNFTHIEQRPVADDGSKTVDV